MSIYTPRKTTHGLYEGDPVDVSDDKQVWWDEEGHPWTEYMFDSSDEEEDEEDLFPSDSEDSDSEFDSVGDTMRLSLLKALAEEAAAAGRDAGARRKESAQRAALGWMFGPWQRHSEAAGSDEEQEQELMECTCCGNIWDGKAQCYCMCYGCEKCETTIMEKEIEDEEWDEESLVRETYGRRTYNFGDTEIGPGYEAEEEEHTTMNYF